MAGEVKDGILWAVDRRQRRAHLQIHFVCVLCTRVHNLSTLHPQSTDQIPERMEPGVYVLCPASELETVSNKWPNSVSQTRSWRKKEANEIPASTGKAVAGILGVHKLPADGGTPENLSRTQNLLYSKTSAHGDPILTPLTLQAH